MGALKLEDHAQLQMVLKIFAHAGQVQHQRNAELAQPLARSHTRYLEQLGRTDRPCRQHEFAARAVNLTKLESRPTKRGLGDYCFFIDCEGHVSDEIIADALRNLSAKNADVKFLGSYPVGGPLEAGVARRRAAGRAWKHASARAGSRSTMS